MALRLAKWPNIPNSKQSSSNSSVVNLIPPNRQLLPIEICFCAETTNDFPNDLKSSALFTAIVGIAVTDK